MYCFWLVFSNVPLLVLEPFYISFSIMSFHFYGIKLNWSLAKLNRVETIFWRKSVPSFDKNLIKAWPNFVWLIWLILWLKSEVFSLFILLPQCATYNFQNSVKCCLFYLRFFWKLRPRQRLSYPYFLSLLGFWCAEAIRDNVWAAAIIYNGWWLIDPIIAQSWLLCFA